MPHRPARPLAVLLAAIALLASACVSAGPASERHERPGQPGSAPVSSRSDPPSAGRPGPTRAGATVRVVMNDRFRYRPDAIMVREGRRVTFAVTNVGRLPHEFVLGDRATQLDHERLMQGSMTGGQVHTHGGGHAGHGTGGLTVPPGETRRVTRTFDEPGIILYGCHVLGHWAAGMKGTIVVVASDRPPAPAFRLSARPLRAAPGR